MGFLPLIDYKLVQLFKDQNEVELKWFWEPYHRVGFDALKFAAQNGMSREVFSEKTKDLSCIFPPKKGAKKFEQLGILDSDGRVKCFDPEMKIAQTLKLLPHGLDDLKNQEAQLFSISSLKNLIWSSESQWEPVISQCPEIHEVSNWLTNAGDSLNSFHSLDGWKKLEALECLIGLSKSASILHFRRFTPVT